MFFLPFFPQTKEVPGPGLHRGGLALADQPYGWVCDTIPSWDGGRGLQVGTSARRTLTGTGPGPAGGLLQGARGLGPGLGTTGQQAQGRGEQGRWGPARAGPGTAGCVTAAGLRPGGPRGHLGGVGGEGAGEVMGAGQVGAGEEEQQERGAAGEAGVLSSCHHLGFGGNLG